MPRRLLRPHSESYYHVYSRVVDRNRTMKQAEKRHFHNLMRRLEKFSGVQVVTYCLMENHFHLLVRVPQRDIQPALTEAELRQLLPLIYRQRQLKEAQQELDRAAQDSTGTWMAEILARYQARRFSLSIFVKELKQRYSRWHNRRHHRTGTLWEHRFGSLLVEGDETALLTVAAYIDLNPVRAGLVGDPVAYRWSGYAEAVAGQKSARRGLAAILQRSSFAMNRRVNWCSIAPRYRVLLYGHGGQRDADARTGSKSRPGMSQAEVAKVLERGGELSVSQILLCKVRYLTDGAAIGGAGFLQQVFEENRDRFGEKRSTGGRRMSGSDWGGLQVLRQLRRRVFG